MDTNQSREGLLPKLEALRRRVERIQRTPNQEDRRAMLSSLLRDLRILDRLDPDILPPGALPLLEQIRRAADDLRQILGKPSPAKNSTSPPARREAGRNGAPHRRATGKVRASQRIESREPADRGSSAEGLPQLRGQDPEGDRSGDRGGGLRSHPRQMPEELSRKSGEPSGESYSPEEVEASHQLLAEKRPLTAAEWRQLGFPRGAAKYLAERRTTLRDLRRMNRSEFRGIQGAGPVALRVCERLLGRPLPSDLPDARVTFWEGRGIQRSAARALVRAGITSLADLNGKSREDLGGLPRIGDGVIDRLEELRGKPLPRRALYWAESGLPPRLSKALIRAGIYTAADFAALTRESFLAIHGLGEPSLHACEAATGHTLQSALDLWTAHGFPRNLGRKLLEAGISDMARLRALNTWELRRLGLGWTEISHCARLIKKK